MFWNRDNDTKLKKESLVSALVVLCLPQATLIYTQVFVAAKGRFFPGVFVYF